MSTNQKPETLLPCDAQATSCPGSPPDPVRPETGSPHQVPEDQDFVIGQVKTAIGPVPRVTTRLTWRDRLGTARVRAAFGRSDYKVTPGLYAVGEATADSPVLVSANYKLSFDHLRSAVDGLDAWILVLDTNGINVWCAAGKRTFGTDQLVERIEASQLHSVVSHLRLILPRLGAPGVAAFKVTKRTRFKVVWGPILAADIPRFLADGKVASLEMTQKSFPLSERAVLVPVEVSVAARPLALAMPVVAAIGGLAGDGTYLEGLLQHGLPAAFVLLAAVLAGAVLMPLLLPWLPGRAFSVKGLWTGLAVTTTFAVLFADQGGLAGWLEAAAWILAGTAFAAFLSLNFTGSSTYTSLSGVKREMRVAVPLQLVAAVVGVTLWITSLWLA